MNEQLQFAFPLLDFPGRTTLTVAEIAAKLGWTEKHIGDLVTEGELPAINGAGKNASRGSYRIPVESYRDWVTARMTGERRVELLKHLPRATLFELVRELNAFLKASA
jgi:hypothetical protein